LNSKHVKLIAAAGLFVVGGVLLYFNLSRPGALPDQVQFVCVVSGETFYIDRDEVRVPAANPSTGEPTLVPCYEDTNGVIRVSEHFRFAVDELGEKNRYVDPETLAVRQPS
jgi:hypothetical protein